MSTSYHIVCLDCEAGIDLGKPVSFELGQEIPTVYIPTTIGNVLTGFGEDSQEISNNSVFVALLGNFLIQHSGHELRVVSHHYLASLSDYSNFTPYDANELKLYLELNKPVPPDTSAGLDEIDLLAKGKPSKEDGKDQ